MFFICRCLVEFGIDVNKKDRDGFICVDMVFKYLDKKYYMFVYLMSSCNLESFEIDKVLQYLVDKNLLNVEIFKYMKENIFLCKKIKNILYYFVLIGYEFKI